MKQQWVSDDVWQQLDPHAGALNRSQRRRAVAVAAAVVAVLAAGFATDRSGIVRAQVAFDQDTGLAGSVLVHPRIITHEIPVKNTGWTTVRVTGVGQDGPGLSLVRPGDAEGMTAAEDTSATPPPFDLHPGQTAIMQVAYRITDCAAVPAGPFPIAVRVDRPWGTETISVSVPPQPVVDPAAPGFTVNGPVIEWQRAAADQSCHPKL
ncbi:hypothetical protein Caci_1996 [Catenulispora acidiphila DSM 44928]|uniref:Uncharacterized protein n=1 Tax=Catenulispora acidiphila (strain DSM 44928 / JCM 14897 / NBRC 102108 / NRRL B-24433 / ID139908) TaxID=479433 RepID=C7QFT9_CATAD|nr:hypothetical protein [Catenulispora acidiphila]ACU70916.1 hypothetical protein Caci_1996 [Catenulispora acidiphila DSM 44928]